MREPLIYSKIRITGFLNTLLLPLPIIHTFFFFNNKPSNEIVNEMNLKGGIRQGIISLVTTGKIVPAMILLIKEKVSKVPWYITIISVFATIYHLFVLATVVLSLKSNKLDIYTKLLLLLTIFYFTFIPGAVGYTRFRVPVEPYLLILSAIKLSGNIIRESPHPVK